MERGTRRGSRGRKMGGGGAKEEGEKMRRDRHRAPLLPQDRGRSCKCSMDSESKGPESCTAQSGPGGQGAESMDFRKTGQ